MTSRGSPVKSYDYLLKFLLVGDSDVGKGEILGTLDQDAESEPGGFCSGLGELCLYLYPDILPEV